MTRSQFDRGRLSIRPLGERVHDLQQPDILKRPGGERIAFEHPALPVLAERTVAAARGGLCCGPVAATCCVRAARRC